MGRVLTLVFVLIGCLLAPYLEHPRLGGIFKYIQEFQGFISPGIVAAFVFGMLIKSAPPAAGTAALLLNPLVYGALFILSGQIEYFDRIGVTIGEIAFLNRMAVTFGVLVLVMAVITILRPLREPKAMPVREDFDMRPAPSVLWLGGAVIAGVVAFYAVFW
jgi:SSS family solute:Na+ symporter